MLVHDFRPVRNFMHREAELARIARTVADGNSVLLVGIRNTGKTQVIKAALTQHQQTHAHGEHLAAMLDVQALRSLSDFYAELLGTLPRPILKQMVDRATAISHLPDKLLAGLRKHIQEVGVAGMSLKLTDPQHLSDNWRTLHSALELTVAAQCTAHGPNSLPLLGIDELPFMLQELLQRQPAKADVTALMAELRTLRNAGLRLLLGGSVSLENLLTLNDISHTVLGDLRRETVPPFTLVQAQAFLKVTLAGSPGAAHINTILSLLPDKVPAHLETAANIIGVERQLDEDKVRWLMRHQVLSAIRKAFLVQFEERLVRHYDATTELPLAEQILDQVAQHGQEGGPLNTTGMPSQWRKVLTRLEADMFLEDAPDLGKKFSLNIQRNWWRAQRGMA